MKISSIMCESSLGRPAEYTYRYHETVPDVLTVIFPGQAYFKDSPLMWYSALSAFEAGSDVLSVEYGFQSNRKDPTEDILELTNAEISEFLHSFLEEHHYEEVIFISKSIGTFLVSRLCKNSFKEVKKHILQTPLKPTIQFMNSTEKALVLVGDEDPAFGPEDRNQLKQGENIRLVLFPGANHIMEVSGNYRKSLEYLDTVASETFKFTEAIVKKVS